jgi:ribonuclease BN (tRNA processing enzyme)
VSLVLTVLGCDGSYPGPGGACSGYLVRGGGSTVWLEAGSGTLAGLQMHAGLEDIDAVVVSHEHPDHWSDLEGLCSALLFGPADTGPPRRDRPKLAVYGPAGVRARMQYLEESPIAWNEVSDGSEVSVGAMTLSFSRTDHGPETLAVRVEADGATLGYSSDSGPGWSLEAFGRGLDLALCEATFTKRDEGRLQHMSARQAGQSARVAGARRLMLTHRWPSVAARDVYEEGSDAYGRPVELAERGRSEEVGGKRTE